MKRLTHIATAALLVSLSATACNDDPLLDLGDRLPPTISISSPDNNGTYTAGDAISFDGSGVDQDGNLLAGAQLVWTSSLDGQIGTGATFTRDDLSEGAHEITLTGTDGFGETNSTSVDITVEAAPANENPVITITSPVDQETYSSTEDISFEGSGVDQNSNALAGDQLVWTSSIDGEIGTGAAFAAQLSTGVHEITLTGTDGDGFVGTASVEIAVANPPILSITSPADAAVFAQGADVTFEGSGEDFDGNVLAGDQLVWTSDIDDQIGTGATFTVNDLTPGTHIITLTGTDANGLSSTLSVTIDITPSFSLSIQPYFTENGCTACHGAGAQLGGFRLDSYTEITTGTTTGGDPLVVPGDATQGVLIPQIQAGHQGAPHGTDIEAYLISWVNAGAEDN